MTLPKSQFEFELQFDIQLIGRWCHYQTNRAKFKIKLGLINSVMRFELGGAFWYIGSLAVVTKSDFALASKCFYGFASSRPSNAESYDETILSLLYYML